MRRMFRDFITRSFISPIRPTLLGIPGFGQRLLRPLQQFLANLLA